MTSNKPSNALTTSAKASSFVLANGQTPEFSDSALKKGKVFLQQNSRLDSAAKDELDELRAKKRKRYYTDQRKKALKLKKNDSIDSAGNSELTGSSANDDDIEWSDCDEAEISRNISLLEQSINITSSFTEKEQRSPLKNHRVNTNTTSGVKSASQSSPHQTSTPNLVRSNTDNVRNSGDDDDDVDWSDCDEAEISRNISLLEKSINCSAVSKHDRSALHEISNLSGRDQSESNSQYLLD